jgi:thiol-disulfide isomerase/thioredoxin
MLHVIRKFSPEKRRYILLFVVLLLVVGSLFLLNDSRTGIAKESEILPEQITMEVEEKEKQYPLAREIVSPSGFINTKNGEPITVKEFIGEKVILIDFWTYSCINCQRTQPYLNAWYEKYEDDGLVILGVHTPEFDFEKVYENVERATLGAGIKYPVVLDNDYGTWSAYQNRYWPRKYLIDIDGFVIYDHIGEGGYEKTEKIIQEALAERAERLGENMKDMDTGIVAPSGVEKVDPTKPRTPEIYFGALRNGQFIGNGKGSVTGEQTFEHPGTFISNKLYLGGTWNITKEFARSVEGARIVLPYQAQKVFMVASSKNGAKLRILVDGKPLGDGAGIHVSKDGALQVEADQLYRIIEADEYGLHVLEIIVEEGVLDAFAFTFG